MSVFSRRTLFVVVLIGVTLALFLTTRLMEPTVTSENPTRAFGGGRIWQLEVVKTDIDRALGLGERDILPSGHGMLFLFEKSDYYGFWMKGMRFPIDIVFLSSGRVVSVERSVGPTRSEIFRPPQPINQVLEVNAGEAASLFPGKQLWYWRGFSF